jgi:hypothetical protein
VDLLSKLMICAAGAAEHACHVGAEHGFGSEEFTRAWSNQRAAIKDVEAQRRFLKQQGLMPAA